jgi:hypothetical protein
MKHLGDISRVNGAEIEPVSRVIFGSKSGIPDFISYQKKIVIRKRGRKRQRK